MILLNMKTTNVICITTLNHYHSKTSYCMNPCQSDSSSDMILESAIHQIIKFIHRQPFMENLWKDEQQSTYWNIMHQKFQFPSKWFFKCVIMFLWRCIQFLYALHFLRILVRIDVFIIVDGWDCTNVSVSGF